MAGQSSSPVLLRFGAFDVRPEAGELRKSGIRVRLSGQPFRVLLLLLEHPGELVTRERLREQIWSDGTIVDFEGGLNAAINKLRRALNDSAENPRYVETVPGRGYRFIGVLESAAPLPPAPPLTPAVTAAMPTTPTTVPRRPFWWGLAVVAGLFIIIVSIVIARRFWTSPVAPTQWQFAVLTPDGENNDSPAVSRDGRFLAYSSEEDGMRDLYIKQIPGGHPVRLTSDGAGNTTPDFSPDGTHIVFRSNRDGGGIYEIGAFGGEPRLLARDGFNPKYSPDGTKVAFWIGELEVAASVPGNGTVWVIPTAGGQPSRVGSALSTARNPLWSPDGRRLLVVGYASAKIYENSALDWWTIELNRNVPMKTGMREALQKAGLNDDYVDIAPANTLTVSEPDCWLSNGNRVIFGARSGDARNLWSTQLGPDGRIAGNFQRITTGSGNEASASCGSQESIIFARRAMSNNIWFVPLDLQHGKPSGAARPMTSPISTEREGPSLSADGRYLAFSSDQSGVFNVWLRNIATGKETQVAPSPFPQRYPGIAPSGGRIAYSSYENNRRILYLAAPGGVPEKLCDGCLRPTDWSRDEKRLLTFGGSPYRISLLDVASHQQTTLLAHPTYSLLFAHFSPDNRWVSFTARVQTNRSWIMIAPVDGSLPVPESSWIRISEEGPADASLWSPDGGTLYFTSSRDGNLCIWARRINPQTHQPIGEPFAIKHFHEHKMELIRIWSAAGGRLAVTLTNDTSNIWMMSRLATR